MSVVLAPLGTNVANRILGMDTRCDFLKGQDWSHKREQMVFQSERKILTFMRAFIRKGRNQDFSYLNPKVTGVFFFF